MSRLAADGSMLDIGLIDVIGHGIDVAPQTLALSKVVKDMLDAHPGEGFPPAVNDHLYQGEGSWTPAQHVSLDLRSGGRTPLARRAANQA